MNDYDSTQSKHRSIEAFVTSKTFWNKVREKGKEGRKVGREEGFQFFTIHC